MNILVVCHYGLYQDLTSSFVHAQAKAYAAQGHWVRVIIPVPVGKVWEGHRVGPFHAVRKDGGVELYYARFLSLSNFGKRWFNTISAKCAVRLFLGQLLRDFTPDVIHAHALGLSSQVGAWLKGRLGRSLVVTTHGSDTSIPVEQGRAAELKPFCDEADHVAAVSSALADKLRACGTGTPISVILNGFQPRYLPGNTQKEPLSFIQVGNLLEQKRFHVTIRVIADIRKRHPGASLTIVGQGPERPALEALCRELGVEDAVRFLGQLPNREVLAEMAKARFFVMPSVREGFGIVYLEAMASGCVAIGTEGEGIADLIISGENGILVPPDAPEAIAEAIETWLAAPARTDLLAERGRQAAMSLTWEANARQYLTLFQSLFREELKRDE